MRWVLPLVLVVALSVGTGDAPQPAKPKLPRAVLAGPAWSHAAAAPPDHGAHDLAVTVATASAMFDDRQVAVLQSAAFDAATGTLTWFDDEDYN